MQNLTSSIVRLNEKRAKLMCLKGAAIGLIRDGLDFHAEVASYRKQIKAVEKKMAKLMAEAA